LLSSSPSALLASPPTSPLLSLSPPMSSSTTLPVSSGTTAPSSGGAVSHPVGQQRSGAAVEDVVNTDVTTARTPTPTAYDALPRLGRNSRSTPTTTTPLRDRHTSTASTRSSIPRARGDSKASSERKSPAAVPLTPSRPKGYKGDWPPPHPGAEPVRGPRETAPGYASRVAAWTRRKDRYVECYGHDPPT
jgi:hypothetical protein